jgi:cytochrome c oxidase subunit 2
MPIHVKVVSAEDYSAWVNEQKKAMAALADDPSKVWTLADLVKRGEGVYANCVACHQANGKGAGAFKPLDGSALVLAEDNKDFINIMLNGKGAMPSWKQLSDTEIAAVMTYVQNTWSNQTGRMVQPADIKAAR